MQYEIFLLLLRVELTTLASTLYILFRVRPLDVQNVGVFVPAYTASL